MYRSRPNWRLSHNTTKWVTPKGLREAGAINVNGTSINGKAIGYYNLKSIKALTPLSNIENIVSSGDSIFEVSYTLSESNGYIHIRLNEYNANTGNLTWTYSDNDNNYYSITNVYPTNTGNGIVIICSLSSSSSTYYTAHVIDIDTHNVYRINQYRNTMESVGFTDNYVYAIWTGGNIINFPKTSTGMHTYSDYVSSIGGTYPPIVLGVYGDTIFYAKYQAHTGYITLSGTKVTSSSYTIIDNTYVNSNNYRVYSLYEDDEYVYGSIPHYPLLYKINKITKQSNFSDVVDSVNTDQLSYPPNIYFGELNGKRYFGCAGSGPNYSSIWYAEDNDILIKDTSIQYTQHDYYAPTSRSYLRYKLVWPDYIYIMGNLVIDNDVYTVYNPILEYISSTETTHHPSFLRHVSSSSVGLVRYGRYLPKFLDGYRKSSDTNAYPDYTYWCIRQLIINTYVEV